MAGLVVESTRRLSFLSHVSFDFSCFQLQSINTNLLHAIMADEKKYTIPYRSQLQEKFEPGQTLICKGSTIPESQKFNINFHHVSSDGAIVNGSVFVAEGRGFLR